MDIIRLFHAINVFLLCTCLKLTFLCAKKLHLSWANEAKFNVEYCFQVVDFMEL